MKKCILNSDLGTLLTWVRDISIFSKVFLKISKIHEKHDLSFYLFFRVLIIMMVLNETKKTGNGKLNLSKKKKKWPKLLAKVIKVDVTKASLTHTMKKLKYFKGLFFFFISVLVCYGKLLPLHNLVKSE